MSRHFVCVLTPLLFALQTRNFAMLTREQSPINEGKHPPLRACEFLCCLFSFSFSRRIALRPRPLSCLGVYNAFFNFTLCMTRLSDSVASCCTVSQLVFDVDGAAAELGPVDKTRYIAVLPSRGASYTLLYSTTSSAPRDAPSLLQDNVDSCSYQANVLLQMNVICY